MTELEKRKEELIKVFYKLAEDNSNWRKSELRGDQIYTKVVDKLYFNIDMSKYGVYVYIDSVYHFLFKFGFLFFITNKEMRKIIKRIDDYCNTQIINENEKDKSILFEKAIKTLKTKADVREEKLENILNEEDL